MKNKNTKTKNKQEIKPLPSNEAELSKDLKLNVIGFYDVEDDESYVHLGINPNDILIVRAASENDENLLTCWQFSGGYDFGFAYENFGEIGFAGCRTPSRYKKKDVRLIGVVIGIVKPFKIEAPAIVRESEMMSVVCSQCGKKDEGSEAFLKGMGWKLRGNKMCLHCDLY